MQTCTICNAQSPDAASNCVHCAADMSEFSSTSVALKHFQRNPRVRILRVMAMHDACPACQQVAAAYPKDAAPQLPVKGCSNGLGCRCFYQPYLDEIYP